MWRNKQSFIMFTSYGECKMTHLTLIGWLIESAFFNTIKLRFKKRINGSLWMNWLTAIDDWMGSICQISRNSYNHFRLLTVYGDRWGWRFTLLLLPCCHFFCFFLSLHCECTILYLDQWVVSVLETSSDPWILC